MFDSTEIIGHCAPEICIPVDSSCLIHPGGTEHRVSLFLYIGVDSQLKTQLEKGLEKGALHPLLTAADIEEARGYHATSVAHFLARRILLRDAYLRYSAGNDTADTAGALAVIRGPHGKPAFACDEHAPLFSLSASGNAVAVAFCKDRGNPDVLGIDIEGFAYRHRDRERIEAVMEYFYSGGDRWYVDDGDGWLSRFLFLWTRKEAVVKLAGESIGSHAIISEVRGDIWSCGSAVASGMSMYISHDGGYLLSLAHSSASNSGDLVNSSDSQFEVDVQIIDKVVGELDPGLRA